MKKIITLLLIAFTVNCYSQNAEQAKPYIVKGDDLFAKKDYQHALEAYNNAIRNDRGDDAVKAKRDTCVKYYNVWKQETEHKETANAAIKQLKEKGAELIFDDNGNAVNYKNKEGEIKSVAVLPATTQREISNVKRKDWEEYK